MFYSILSIFDENIKELTLTGKDCGQAERAPMCGIPYHSCEAYIQRLLEKGYKVAIVEQVENPKEANGIVKRDVVRIVTPGTIIEDTSLDAKANNFLISLILIILMKILETL